ncbi:MAG: hypothetical protein EA403_12470 [Spirochaetaceae bacterium]|nr:MAG: hypothetical protein EA403_12470 [Spirochaetaceae bacterium]
MPIDEGKPSLFKRIEARVKDLAYVVGASHREKVTALTSCEVREIENMFVLLLMGSFTGLPSPPSFISIELMPHLEHEIRVVNRRAENADDALAEMAGCLDIM